MHADRIAKLTEWFIGIFMTETHLCPPLWFRATKPQLGAPRKFGQGCRFSSFSTNNFKLHFMETPSGFKVHSSLSGACDPLLTHGAHDRAWQREAGPERGGRRAGSKAICARRGGVRGGNPWQLHTELEGLHGRVCAPACNLDHCLASVCP